MFKISRGYRPTAIDNKIIKFRTDSHTRGDFKFFKPHCKVNARAFSFAARHVSSFKRLLCACTCDLTPFLRSKCDF